MANTKAIVGGATENTAYYWVNGELLAKKDPSGNRFYYHNDHLGSASVMTDSSGALVESTKYDPWGEVTSGGTKSKFQYTGQEKDSETGLNYYNARYYDPHMRRFTQPDSLVQNIYDPQSLNRYAYVRNNPLRYTDPCGHFWTELIDQIVERLAPSIIRVISSIPVVNKFINNPTVQSGVQKAQPVINSANKVVDVAKKVSSPVNTTGTKIANEVDTGINKTINTVVDNGTSSKWYKSTFDTVEKSIKYHMEEHGNGRTFEQYTEDAQTFYKENRDIMQNVTLKDGTEGVHFRIGGQGGYYTPGGKIVTYWD